ncbi:GSCFA domain-containing protein [Sabulilitoribacter multivorans]|uniref:GSCFA domain-containing protein n=1 Tax=Flaviramulus multivorans TaxID=1304750 RepID=A0ABS9IJ18_9FLAO|nr:GSCFA domain-containing protein [Flaviramulus multivorans]MCF7560600.1 GSCFA domain-containing protein [Flaviramulus multivorans]
MKLQTKIPLQPQQHNQIDYNSSVLLLGSCFVENIGSKLNYFKFQNLQNPFGILFQTFAIEKLITNALNEKEFTKDSIFFLNEQWHCYDAHSKLSNASENELLHVLKEQISLTAKQLHNSSHIIITLGTAWVYKHLETNTIVANCHKVPQKQFLKELMSVDEVVESLQSIITLVRSVNKKASILFTVSPVRHLKDGFIENTQSKAHLITAVHQVVNTNKSIYYFPSYEIMMDELRDYRFYKEDMIHPNETAIQYIWEKFKDVWISKSVNKIMDEVDCIQKGLQHKPFNPNSDAQREFLQKLQVKVKTLQTQFPHIVF